MIDALTLDQMQIFVAAVDEGSFSAAARKLGRVQSAVSQSVAALEGHLGVALFDRSGKMPRLTPAGAALAKDARRLVEDAIVLKRRAACIADKVEPELVFAVDAIFPHEPLIASLKALRDQFPAVPVSIFTESLGGSEQRLRDGVAQFALYPTPPYGAGDLVADFLAAIDVLPVVGVDHPLAKEPEPIARVTLEPHVQLVLTDRTPLTQNFSGGIVSHHVWRFADLSNSARIPAGRLRLVQDARPPRPGADRRGTAESAQARRAGSVSVPSACRAGARPRNRPRRTLADRGLAGADERAQLTMGTAPGLMAEAARRAHARTRRFRPLTEDSRRRRFSCCRCKREGSSGAERPLSRAKRLTTSAGRPRRPRQSPYFRGP